MKILIILLFIVISCESRYLRVPFDRTSWMEKTSSLKSERISFGDPASIEDFPHMLAMISIPSGGFMCGASIIHKYWALTAAHCISAVPPNQINFRGGSTNRLSGGIIFIAEDLIIHPDYDDWYLKFDVAIVKIHNGTPMEGFNVQAIPLPQSCDELCCNICEDVSVTVSGWGVSINSYYSNSQLTLSLTYKTNEHGVLPENLVQLTSPVHDHRDCAELWLNTVYHLNVGPDYFCQKSTDRRGTCRGDSGSPAIIRQGESKIQVGVVSFGPQICGGADFLPSGYTRIEYRPIRDWIQELTGV